MPSIRRRRGLQRGEADLALAGGVNAILTVGVTRQLDTGGMLSPEGRCKTFDAAANGFVRGEGCGMLVLKRLADAERDGDRIQGSAARFRGEPGRGQRGADGAERAGAGGG